VFHLTQNLLMMTLMQLSGTTICFATEQVFGVHHVDIGHQVSLANQSCKVLLHTSHALIA